LPPSCNNQRLFSLFSAYGTVDKAYILYDHKTGCSRGFGFVEFIYEEDLNKALEQNINVDGKIIQCSRVFLKQEERDKQPHPQVASDKSHQGKAVSTNNCKTQKQKSRGDPYKDKGLSYGKVSVPDLVTQGSWGSSASECEKEPVEDNTQVSSPLYTDTHQLQGYWSSQEYYEEQRSDYEDWLDSERFGWNEWPAQQAVDWDNDPEYNGHCPERLRSVPQPQEWASESPLLTQSPTPAKRTLLEFKQSRMAAVKHNPVYRMF